MAIDLIPVSMLPDVAVGIDVPCPSYNGMLEAWDLPVSLYGGTRAMRAAGKKWLPAEPKEDDQRYNLRLGRSILHNCYKFTLKKLSGKPFSKPVVINFDGTIPEAIERMDGDVDGRKKNITQFCRPLFELGIHFGLSHVLVDYPVIEGTSSLQYDRENNVHPIFSVVSPLDLIYWRYDKNFTGSWVLSEIRVKEEIENDDGSTKKRVKVIIPGEWALYEETLDRSKTQTTYVKISGGRFKLGYIPLRTFYVNETGPMTGEPALEDLAWQNLAHWQSFSDQRSILRVARVANLFAKGIREEEIDKNIKSVGPNAVWWTENKDGDIKFVEHSGASIAAGRQDILDLEARMETYGMQPLVERSGNATATGKAIDEAKTMSDMQVWVTDFQEVIKLAYVDAFAWVDAMPSEKFSVDIFQDFNISARYNEDIVALGNMRLNNWITPQTYLREVKRRGLLAEDLDIDAETVEAKEQEMQFGMPTFPGNQPRF